MLAHNWGRQARQPVARDCHSLGIAWPTVPRSAHSIASVIRSRGDNHGILG
jgi:hypothetical protein